MNEGRAIANCMNDDYGESGTIPVSDNNVLSNDDPKEKALWNILKRMENEICKISELSVVILKKVNALGFIDEPRNKEAEKNEKLPENFKEYFIKSIDKMSAITSYLEESYNKLNDLI